MRKAAQPIFDLMVSDARFESFSVKDLREFSERATSALVTHSVLKKFEKASEADKDSADWETRLFGRLRAAGEAIGDPAITSDIYMMMHLRD